MSAAWHDEARALHAQGMELGDIAAAVGHNRQMVRWALDIEGEREKQRQRVKAARERERLKRLQPRTGRAGPPAHPRVSAKRNPLEASDDKAAARAYTRKDRARAEPSLPVISLPPAIDDGRPAFRLAPKPRMTSSPGAERWRQIHLAMIRAGKIAPRGDLLSEIGR